MTTSLKLFLILYYIKQIDSKLPCVCTTFLFLPHFDVICDLLLNRHTATWNLFVNYIISSVMHAFWLVLTYDLLEDRRIDDVIIKTFLILYYIKQIDSKLPCVCSEIDHRWRQIGIWFFTQITANSIMGPPIHPHRPCWPWFTLVWSCLEQVNLK